MGLNTANLAAASTRLSCRLSILDQAQRDAQRSNALWAGARAMTPGIHSCI